MSTVRPRKSNPVTSAVILSAALPDSSAFCMLTSMRVGFTHTPCVTDLGRTIASRSLRTSLLSMIARQCLRDSYRGNRRAKLRFVEVEQLEQVRYGKRSHQEPRDPHQLDAGKGTHQRSHRVHARHAAVQHRSEDIVDVGRDNYAHQAEDDCCGVASIGQKHQHAWTPDERAPKDREYGHRGCNCAPYNWIGQTDCPERNSDRRSLRESRRQNSEYRRLSHKPEAFAQSVRTRGRERDHRSDTVPQPVCRLK